MDGNKITLVIEGLPEDAGRVRFNTFMTQLQRLNATLIKLDREAHDGKSAAYFEIAGLSYASPVRVTVEAKPLKQDVSVGPVIVSGLRNLTAAIKSGADLSAIDADLLEDIQGLAKQVGSAVKSVSLIFDDDTFDLTEKVAANVNIALAVEDECEGVFDGMLEQINLHHGANTFHIYPQIGPRKITCNFPPRLYDDAVAAVGRRVEISGLLRYRAGAKFPHQIVVSGIDVFPPDSELADWDDLRGRAPGLTGDLTSEAFVRELRDGWV
ncbi:MAG: hypothetical protein J0H10_05800 [Alphaproteobacteria bacterium]|nr:hypothetical protein [Alphaproteobacteria bacterium]